MNYNNQLVLSKKIICDVHLILHRPIVCTYYPRLVCLWKTNSVVLWKAYQTRSLTVAFVLAVCQY